MPRAARILTLILVVFAVGEIGTRAEGEEGEADPGFTTLFDFESGTWEGWTVRGDAFGPVPLEGDAPEQTPVDGFLGRHLANSYAAGDAPKGRLRSALFTLDRPYLRFLVGGGKSGVAVRLLVDGKARFEATGEEREHLSWRCWDVRPYAGRRARLEVVDDTSGSWGHILLDHVELVDEPGPVLVSCGVFRRIHDPSEGESRAWYVNDHTVVRGPDGTWHLIGITHPEPAAPLNEVLFCHATAKKLTGRAWKKHPPAFAADVAGWKEQHIWAPYVLQHDDRWWMYYCAGDIDHEQYRIHLATSRDVKTWERHAGSPLFADGFDARDPFVMRVGERWILYYTATSESSGGNHVVKWRTSTDLVNWSEAGIAFRDPARGTFGGPTESPFVVHRGDWYYLFVGPRGGYVGTEVFRSRDPLAFSIDQRVGRLHAHAAEIVADEDGRWYVTHCGWGQGGVWLAPLYWTDGIETGGSGAAE